MTPVVLLRGTVSATRAHAVSELGKYTRCGKDVVFGRRLSDAEVMSADLPIRLAEGLATAMPVFRFLETLA